MILNLAEWSRKATVSYSGSYTTKSITVNGKSYTLYSFTGSGTLTITGGKLKNADIWACGGGGSPALIKTSAGGGGGYTAQLNGQALSTGQYVITIGAAEAATSITRGGTALLTANGAPVLSGSSDANRSKGGSGGGSTGGYVYSAPGQGTTTRPFGDTANFVSIPCAGGGGGGGHRDYTYGYGGDGGSNGSNGKPGSEYGENTKPHGGKGGDTGGGKGSSDSANGVSYADATAATYYGGGGGGARTGKNVGYGYQGWLLLRVPIKATPAPSGSYTYYRLNMTGMMRDSASGTFFSVAELKLYNGSAAISYTGATFTASSSLTGYPVAQAFDGNASTIWHVDGSPASAWIQAQLSSAAKVTSFSITARSDQNDRLNAFTLQGSNDGSSWTTLYTGSNTASGWAQGDTKTFTI